MTSPENIRSSDATTSWYVGHLGGRGGLILTGNAVKHEQKKKDKSAKLLKELDSETRDAVNLAHRVRTLSADDGLQIQGKTLEVQGLWDEVLFPLPLLPNRKTDILQE